jgi:hypothetical protein
VEILWASFPFRFQRGRRRIHGPGWPYPVCADKARADHTKAAATNSATQPARHGSSNDTRVRSTRPACLPACGRLYHKLPKPPRTLPPPVPNEHGGGAVLPRLLVAYPPPRHSHGPSTVALASVAAAAPPRQVLQTRGARAARPVQLCRQGGIEAAHTRCLLRGLIQPARFLVTSVGTI